MNGDVKPTKAYRGFAAMNPSKQRGIAAKGGGAHAPETRPFNNRELAAEAGRKGGRAPKIPFAGQEADDYRRARKLGFSASEAGELVIRSRR